MIRYHHFFAAEGSGKHFELLGALEAECAKVGYYHLPHASRHLALAQSVYETIAIVGIGGSSLGIKALERLLRHRTPHARRLVYLENSDPFGIHEQLSKIDPTKTLFIVISKSGGTIETLSIFKYLIDHFGLSLMGNPQIMVISDEASPLMALARENQWERFSIPENVGGRFSVLSAVGMVPLALAGFDTMAILEGAGRFLDRFWAREEDHLMAKAHYYVAHAETYPINVLFAYSDVCSELGQWFVQLWGESLGKKRPDGARVGLTPIGLIGSVDQHSFLQLVIEGPLNKTLTFMRIENGPTEMVIPDISLHGLEKVDFANGSSFSHLINAQAKATEQSVIQSGVSVDEISIDHLDEMAVGELVIYFELLTSACGILLGVNTYDQPGVELGKTILRSYFD